MKHTHHHLLISLSIMVTLFVVSLYFYVSSSVHSMTDAVISAREEVASLQSKNSKDELLKKLNADSSAEWERLYSAFVPVNNVVPFIETLESLGPRAGGQVTVASIDSTIPGDGSLAKNGYVNAKVTARGSWGSVFKILQLAENLPYKTTISNVRMDLTTSEGSKQHTEWTASFDISAIKSI